MSLMLATLAEILLAQDFSNNRPLDAALWDYNHWQAVDNPSFYGRTQIAQALPQVKDGVLQLLVQSYLPGGGAFLGNDIATLQSFEPSHGGIAFSVVARLVNPRPGLDAGIFTYRFEHGLDNEIDFEILTNQVGAAKSSITSNYFVDQPLGGGHLEAAPTPDPTGFNRYTIEWYADEVRWFVNGALVRRLTGRVPHGPSRFHLNFWAVGDDFDRAYDASLQPAASAAANQTFRFEISAVTIGRIAAKPKE
jgi:hypothetical protein